MIARRYADDVVVGFLGADAERFLHDLTEACGIADDSSSARLPAIALALDRECQMRRSSSTILWSATRFRGGASDRVGRQAAGARI